MKRCLVCSIMPLKPIWSWFLFGTLLQAVLTSNIPPSECLVTSFQLLCVNFYARTIDKCISNSLPGDIFVKSKDEICYVLFPDRCISTDFCPQAQVHLKLTISLILMLSCAFSLGVTHSTR